MAPPGTCGRPEPAPRGQRKSRMASSAGSSLCIARRCACPCRSSSPRTPSGTRNPGTRTQISALRNLLFRIHIYSFIAKCLNATDVPVFPQGDEPLGASLSCTKANAERYCPQGAIVSFRPGADRAMVPSRSVPWPVVHTQLSRNMLPVIGLPPVGPREFKNFPFFSVRPDGFSGKSPRVQMPGPPISRKAVQCC